MYVSIIPKKKKNVESICHSYGVLRLHFVLNALLFGVSFRGFDCKAKQAGRQTKEGRKKSARGTYELKKCIARTRHVSIYRAELKKKSMRFSVCGFGVWRKGVLSSLYHLLIHSFALCVHWDGLYACDRLYCKIA